jgi:hypothetical protein
MNQNREAIFVTTYRTSFLSDALSGEKIPVGKLAYFRGRLTNRIHEAVLTEFSRLSQADKINRAQIASRIGRKPEQVTRWLGAPGNWTIETLSDLSLAMGYEPFISLVALAEPTSESIGTHNNVYNFPSPVNRMEMKPSDTHLSSNYG